MVNWNMLFALAAFSGTLFIYENKAIADIVPDTNLPNNSRVSTQNNITTITGGTTAGSNLFHSFQEFSVDSGGTAFFNNTADIQNIITRVTGRSVSNIDGLIKANGSANLFLINPNGFVFGRGAKLEIGGSFVTSTANSLKFADGTQFSTTVTNQSTPLLTVSIPVGLQYGNNSGNIQLQNSNLQVNPGKTLALIGGNVTALGGELVAESGRVELGGLTEAGNIGIQSDRTGNILSLNYPGGVRRGDFTITNGTKVKVTGTGGGDIAVNAFDVNISQRGALSSGIKANSGTTGTVAGNITVNATGSVTLRGSSVLETIVGAGATGNAGNVNVDAASLDLLSGSQLFSTTSGRGHAGSMNVKTRSRVTLDSAGNNASTSGIIASVDTPGEGKGGDVNITTGSAFITNGAQINAITFGQGNAGNVTIKASDRVIADGSNVGASGIITAVSDTGRGNGGDINITAGTMSVTAGAQLNALTKGQGNAGNFRIKVSDIFSLAGENKDNGAASALFSSVDTTGRGNGGEINITAGSLFLTGGAELNTLTSGRGNAGNVTINASDRIFLDGINRNGGVSSILTSVRPNAVGNGGEINISTGSLTFQGGTAFYTLTFGQGNAGKVTIKARDTISIDGINQNGGASGIFSSVGIDEGPGVGSGGDINITTGSLSITGGAGLFSLTKNQGNAGNVTINARDRIFFDGVNQNGGASGIFSSVDTTGVGNGGDIKIATNSLELTGGAGLYAFTKGQGDAGNISVVARERVSLSGVSRFSESGSGIYSTVESTGVGNGKDIRINTKTLSVRDNARISATSASLRGQLNPASTNRAVNNTVGNAGNVEVNANSINLSRGNISSDTVAGQGNINLRSRNLILSRESLITTNAQGENIIGGNIDIDTDILAAIRNSDITANSRNFRGGRVTIDTDAIFGTQFRDTGSPFTSDITATGASPDLSGTVDVTTLDVDPRRGLVPLVIDVVDVASLVDDNVCARTYASTFTITGKGGLPPSPNTTLANNPVWEDWRITAVTTPGREQATTSQNSSIRDRNSGDSTQIIEAQGWVVDKSGDVTLVALAQNSNPHTLGVTNPSCSTR